MSAQHLSSREARHFALSCETLGLGPRPVVLEVGCVEFHPHASSPFAGQPATPSHFCLDVVSQMRDERTIEAETVAWWLREAPGLPVAPQEVSYSLADVDSVLWSMMELGQGGQVVIWYQSAFQKRAIRSLFGRRNQWGLVGQVCLDSVQVLSGRSESDWSWGERRRLPQHVAWVRSVDLAVDAWRAVRRLGGQGTRLRQAVKAVGASTWGRDPRFPRDGLS